MWSCSGHRVPPNWKQREPGIKSPFSSHLWWSYCHRLKCAISQFSSLACQLSSPSSRDLQAAGIGKGSGVYIMVSTCEGAQGLSCFLYCQYCLCVRNAKCLPALSSIILLSHQPEVNKENGDTPVSTSTWSVQDPHSGPSEMCPSETCSSDFRVVPTSLETSHIESFLAWRDGFVSKALTSQTGGPKFHPYHPCDKA